MAKKDTTPNYYQRLAQIESAGDPNAKAGTSSAAGLFQFTKSTWEDMIKTYDLDFTLDDRFDPEKSRIVAEKFTEDNKKYLESRLGREVNDGELYLAHFLGRKGALDLVSKVDVGQNISASDLVSEQAISANAPVFLNEDGSVKTSYDIYNWANKKMKTGVSRKPIPEGNVSVNENIITNNLALDDVQEQELITENEDFGFSSDFLSGLNFGNSVLPDSKTPDDESPTFDGNFSAINNFSHTSDINALEKGGPIEGNSNEVLTEFNEGGTHETSPLGGIPLSHNDQGGLNLVEEGETKFNDYILSNSLYVTEDDIEAFNIDESYLGLSYAEASKKINDHIKERPFDKLTRSTAENQLAQLTYANEKKRVKEEPNGKYNHGGPHDPPTGAPMLRQETRTKDQLKESQARAKAIHDNKVNPLESALAYMANPGAMVGDVLTGLGFENQNFPTTKLLAQKLGEAKYTPGKSKLERLTDQARIGNELLPSASINAAAAAYTAPYATTESILTDLISPVGTVGNQGKKVLPHIDDISENNKQHLPNSLEDYRLLSKDNIEDLVPRRLGETRRDIYNDAYNAKNQYKGDLQEKVNTILNRRSELRKELENVNGDWFEERKIKQELGQLDKFLNQEYIPKLHIAELEGYSDFAKQKGITKKGETPVPSDVPSYDIYDRVETSADRPFSLKQEDLREGDPLPMHIRGKYDEDELLRFDYDKPLEPLSEEARYKVAEDKFFKDFNKKYDVLDDLENISINKYGGTMKKKKNGYYILGGVEQMGEAARLAGQLPMDGAAGGGVSGGAISAGTSAVTGMLGQAFGEKASGVNNVLGSAGQGASAGMMLGPIGAAVGGVLGAGAGILGNANAKKAMINMRNEEAQAANSQYSNTFRGGGLLRSALNEIFDDGGNFTDPTPELPYAIPSIQNDILFNPVLREDLPTAKPYTKSFLDRGLYNSIYNPKAPQDPRYAAFNLPDNMNDLSSPAETEKYDYFDQFFPKQQATGTPIQQSSSPAGNTTSVPPTKRVPQSKVNNPISMMYADVNPDPNRYATLLDDKTLKTVKSMQSGRVENQEEDNDKKFNPHNILRYAPSAANLGKLLFGDNDPEVTSLDRLDNRYNPDYVDENSLLNTVKGATRNTQRAIQNNAAGSASAARAGLLGSQINETNALSNAMIQAENINRGENSKAQEFDARIDNVNLQQSNQEELMNAQARGAAQAEKADLFQAVFGDIGNISREALLAEMLGKTTGYGITGNKIQKKGGLLSNMFSEMNNSEDKQIENYLRERYGY